MSTMSLRKNRARNKKTKRTKSERKRKKQKRENQKKIKELEKDNSHFFFFFFFACLRPISCSRIFFYKMRVLKRDRIYKIKRETNLREKKSKKSKNYNRYLHHIYIQKKKKEIKQCLMYCAPDFTVA